MIYPPNTITSSSYEILLLVAIRFDKLTIQDDVLSGYLIVREALWDIMETAPDTAPFQAAWKRLVHSTHTELKAIENGDADELDRLKQKVRACIELLP